MTSTDDATPPPAPVPMPGAVLLRGAVPAVEAWVVSSVVPLIVAPARPWTVVLGAGPTAVGSPYDDALMLLAARRVPDKAGPALGFFEVDGRALITAHAPGRRDRPSWVVWEPEIGLLRPPGLPLAGPAELASLAGAPAEVRDELVELLHETRTTPRTMLQAVMATLGLPAARVLADPRTAVDLPGAVHRPASARQVAYFDDAVADSVRLRRELGALP